MNFQNCLCEKIVATHIIFYNYIKNIINKKPNTKRLSVVNMHTQAINIDPNV